MTDEFSQFERLDMLEEACDHLQQAVDLIEVASPMIALPIAR